MNNFVFSMQQPFSEEAIRLFIFLALLALFAFGEQLLPRRQTTAAKLLRWRDNLSLSVLNSALVSVLLPLASVGAAALATEQNWGLLNTVTLPGWLDIAVFVLMFDLLIYLQHRLFHSLQPLWKLHRVHHTDLEYDVSTGVRFHPLSIVISSIIKLSLVLLMGPTVLAVLIAEVMLNATSLFNHSNLRIPSGVDKILRLVLVTPDMHRVHHSSNAEEHQRNFGFSFSLWDRLLGTYRAQPELGHEKMVIGINGYRQSHSVGIVPLLLQPFQPDRETP
jgi:sterol desaturase/sphingolipid hydroxylase (fatty acid hydroxylase superfamily)